MEMPKLRTALASTLTDASAVKLIDEALKVFPFIALKENGDHAEVSLVPSKLSRVAEGEGAACIPVIDCPNMAPPSENQYQRVSRESSTLTAMKNIVRVSFTQIAKATAQRSPKKEQELLKFVA